MKVGHSVCWNRAISEVFVSNFESCLFLPFQGEKGQQGPQGFLGKDGEPVSIWEIEFKR